MIKKLFIPIVFAALSAFKIAEERKVHIFLIGDSTMANKNAYDAPETGWGMFFPTYFNEAVEIQNHAVNGRSTKSFRNLGHWKKVFDQLQQGDYVFIQFGHNDQKESDTTRYAHAQTDYRKNLIRYIEEIQSKGATPILLTPVMRRKFDENQNFDFKQHQDYPQVVREIAQQYHIYLIDLFQTSGKLIASHGAEGSKRLFLHFGEGYFKKFPKGIADDTHFSPYGAAQMASLVAQEMMEQGNPLRVFLKKSVYPTKYEYELPKIYQPYFRKDTFNIARYGAKADGITRNTNAINQAIDIANQAGGGTVLLPKGLWLTGPITLKSNVNLHLEKGCVLQFSSNFDDYPLITTNWEGVDAIRCQSPISGVGLQNIAITGEGYIDAAGGTWRQVKKSKLTETQWQKLIASGGLVDEKVGIWYPSEKSLKGSQTPKAGIIKAGFTIEKAQEIKDFLRPNMLSLQNCKYVYVEGVTFQNSPAWTLHPLLCEHISFKKVSVRNPWFGQNNDGIDLESCKNGILEDCTFDTGDDGICIKSGRDEEGRKRGIATENFIIKNCTVFHAHGGFVIGSEMSGGAKNLFVNNCNFLGTDVGLRFKTARGRGGVVEKIYVSDIQMTDIQGEAIIFDMYYQAKDPVPLAGDSNELPLIKPEPLDEGTPQFKDFYIQNITCKGAETGIMLRGLPEMPIKDIAIENVNISSNKGLVCIEAENISLKNVGLFTKSETVMQIQNANKINVDKLSFTANKKLLLHLSGANSKNIVIQNTQVSNAQKNIETDLKISKSLVQIK